MPYATIYVSTDGNDDSTTYWDTNTPLQTIQQAVDNVVAFYGGTLSYEESTILVAPFTISISPGVYREAVTIPPFNAPSEFEYALTLLGATGDAGKCVISGADPIGTEWHDMTGGLYKILDWTYTFEEETADAIRQHRCTLHREFTKNNFLNEYGIGRLILEDLSERQVWVIPCVDETCDLFDPVNVPPLIPEKELQQVFHLNDMRPDTFFVDHPNHLPADFECSGATKDNPGSFAYDPNGGDLYVKLQDAGIPFSERFVIASTRGFCLKVMKSANKVMIKSLGFQLAACPQLGGGVEIYGDNVTLDHCISIWHKGQGMKVQGDTTTLMHCHVRYNSAEGITAGKDCESGRFCHCITNNNSLNYRTINLLSPAHRNSVQLPAFSSGGLVMKGATNCVVYGHESQDNLGNGIWLDHGLNNRIFRCLSRRNIGSGLTIERADHTEVSEIECSFNELVGIRVEGKKCFVHHNYILHNKRAGIGVMATSEEDAKVPTTTWVLNNTIVGNRIGLQAYVDMLTLHVHRNIVACSVVYGVELGGDLSSFSPHITGNDFYYNHPPSYDNNFQQGDLTVPGDYTGTLLLANEDSNPRFSNPCIFDFTLTACSPAREKGELLEQITINPPFPSIVDISWCFPEEEEQKLHVVPAFRDIGAHQQNARSLLDKFQCWIKLALGC